MPLSERDRAILDFERTWWAEPGTKEARIRAQLGLSAARYYQLLSGLVGTAEAESYDPLVVRRLRRVRSRRRRAQIEGRTAGSRRGR